ncbi:MAG: hypothetical protein GY904_19645 [Planctomycetaceae bacterium]|nr:hypothetical protein [Planctomycetaceae bacterium]
MMGSTNGRGFLAFAGFSALQLTGVANHESANAQDAARPPTRQLDQYVDFDATGLAELIRSKQVTPAELVEVFVRRIETINPVINCIATQTFARARSRATQVDKDSVFSGVPSLMKDMVDIGGVRRTDGSRLLATNVPKQSVAWVKAFEESGLNLIGTTTVPEFASGLESELFGKTRNPWNLEYSCVASSSGAGAAVAAGIAPLVHGTDGGGSNRLPSSACNTFGFKPSRGRLLSGEADGSHDRFKTNCSISRTVRDSVALFAATEDPKATDFEPIGKSLGPVSRRLRIAYAPDGVRNLPQTVASVKEAVGEAAKLLEALGHHVEEVEHPVDGVQFFQNYRFAYLPKFVPLLKTVQAITGRPGYQSGLLTPWTASMIESGQNYTAGQIEQGTKYFENVAALYNAVFDRFDVLLTPVMPVETPRIGVIKPSDSFDEKGGILEHTMSLTAPVNPIGDCAMSVPLSFSKSTGMPVGSMFHAVRGKDQLLFQLAFELEAARPWKDHWAPFSIKHIPV